MFLSQLVGHSRCATLDDRRHCWFARWMMSKSRLLLCDWRIKVLALSSTVDKAVDHFLESMKM